MYQIMEMHDTSKYEEKCTCLEQLINTFHDNSEYEEKFTCL